MKKLNLSFLFLLGAVFLFQWPHLSSKLIPIHDTLYVFTFSFPFYNEWYLYREIPQWFPYSTYGLPANFYQAWAFTPVHYLIMLAGSFFRVENALVIFKAGIVSEIFMYLLGFYWLGRALYADKRTIVLVCLAAVGSVIWYSNINVGFRFYYLFPLTAYFLVSFYKQRRPEYLWMAGIAALLWWVQGSVLYHIMGGVFAFFIFLSFLFLASRNLWRVPFMPTRQNCIYFSIFALLLAFFAFYYKQSLDQIDFYAPGRSAESGVAPLSSFLTYGGTADWEKLFKGFFFASPAFIRAGTHLDSNLYVGVLTIVFFVWAVLRVRTMIFMAFLVTAIGLAWLSFGGNFAKLAYYFPGMAYYRHLAFMTGLVKVIVLIGAGFGLDHFWKLTLPRKKYFAAAILWIFFFMITFFRDVQQDFFKHWRWMNEKFIIMDFSNPYSAMLFIGWILFLVSLFAAVLLFFKNKNLPLLGRLLFCSTVLFSCCDLFIFQGRIYDKIPQLLPSEYSALESLKVHSWEYQPVRVREAITERHKQAWKLVRLSPPTAKYGTSFSFIQLDHCDPVYRPDIVTEGILQLVTIPNVKNYLIGCYYPKMRLVKDMVAFKDKKDAAKAIALLGEPSGPVVIHDLKDGYQNVSSSESADKERIEVKKFKSNELIAEVDVKNQPGAWFVYDDAFHPRWRVEVNKKEVPLQQAYLAFKTVYLPQGKNTVRFFYDPSSAIMSISLALINLIFALIFCAFLFRTIFYDRM